MSERAEFYMFGQPFDGGLYHYVESGLPYIYLKNGFTIEDDPDYGRLVTFHEVEELHNAIGLHIVGLDRPIMPREFRFLRKCMRMTQAQLADDFDITDQTVANYEKGATPIPKVTDMALRVMFVLELMPEDMRAGALKELLKPQAANAGRKAKSERHQILKGWREEDQGCVAA